MFDWKLAEAKNRFSEVMTQALTSGPQRVCRRDQAVVILSEQEYQRLTGATSGFVSFLLAGPDRSDLDLHREDGPARDVSL